MELGSCKEEVMDNVERALTDALNELGYLRSDIEGMKKNHNDQERVGLGWEEYAGHVDYQYDLVFGKVRLALTVLRDAKQALYTK